MSYTVMWSGSGEAKAQSANGTPNVYIAMNGEKEARDFAKRVLERGDVVWSVEDQHQRKVAEGEAVQRWASSGPITSGG